MSMLPYDDRDGWIWLDGEFTPWREAKIHVLTHGLHYASAVFEGERMYGGEVFKLAEHTARLFQSGRILDFEIPFTEDEIDAATLATCAKNGLTDCYIRPIAWRGSETIGVAAHNSRIHVAIAVWDWPSYFNPEQKRRGIELAWAKYKRPSPETAPTASKAAGLYMICTLSKHAAEARRLRRRHDARLARLCGRGDRGQRVLRQGRRAAHADAGLLPGRHHPSVGDGAGQDQGLRGDRAAHPARGAG